MPNLPAIPDFTFVTLLVGLGVVIVLCAIQSWRTASRLRKRMRNNNSRWRSDGT